MLAYTFTQCVSVPIRYVDDLSQCQSDCAVPVAEAPLLMVCIVMRMLQGYAEVMSTFAATVQQQPSKERRVRVSLETTRSTQVQPF